LKTGKKIKERRRRKELIPNHEGTSSRTWQGLSLDDKGRKQGAKIG